MRYLIDSNTFIDLLRPRNPNTDKIAESLLLGDDLVIFCLVEYEVKRGYYLSYFSKQSNDVQKNKEQSRIEQFDVLIQSFEYISQIEASRLFRKQHLFMVRQKPKGVNFQISISSFLVVGKRDGCTIVSSDTHIEALTGMYDVPFEKWT